MHKDKFAELLTRVCQTPCIAADRGFVFGFWFFTDRGTELILSLAVGGRGGGGGGGEPSFTKCLAVV